MRFLAALVILVAGVSWAHAQTATTANKIMPGCRNWSIDTLKDPLMQGVCAGGVMAITTIDPSICPPKASTGGQAIRVVVQYIDALPARQHEDFYILAAEALRRAWPCR